MARRGKPRRPASSEERPSRALGIAIGLTAIAVGVLGLSALWGKGSKHLTEAPEVSTAETAASTKPPRSPVWRRGATMTCPLLYGKRFSITTLCAVRANTSAAF